MNASKPACRQCQQPVQRQGKIYCSWACYCAAVAVPPEVTRYKNALYRQRYRERHPERFRASQRLTRQRTQHRRAAYLRMRYRTPQNMARLAVKYALKDGRLVKADHCHYCGSDRWVESHHPDYTKPLEVVWLCRKCHTAIHRPDTITAALRTEPGR